MIAASPKALSASSSQSIVPKKSLPDTTRGRPRYPCRICAAKGIENWDQLDDWHRNNEPEYKPLSILNRGAPVVPVIKQGAKVLFAESDKENLPEEHTDQEQEDTP